MYRCLLVYPVIHGLQKARSLAPRSLKRKSSALKIEDGQYRT